MMPLRKISDTHSKRISAFKGIVSRDFGVIFLFIWIDMKFQKGPDQVYFSL
jgi:hypothetical protein